MRIDTQETHPYPKPPRRGGFYKYRWSEMRVGDSFFVPCGKISTMSSVANRAAARLGTKYTCSTVTENTIRGVRVWRKV